MIDTPRTDSRTKRPDIYHESGGYVSPIMEMDKFGDYVDADFARQLERELFAVTKERDELHKKLEDALHELHYADKHIQLLSRQ